jgi:hypothetical protein
VILSVLLREVAREGSALIESLRKETARAAEQNKQQQEFIHNLVEQFRTELDATDAVTS